MKVVNSKNANKTKHENSSDLKIFGTNGYQRIKWFDFSNLRTCLLHIPISKFQPKSLDGPYEKGN